MSAASVYALKCLTHRSYHSDELLCKLSGEGFTPDEITEALAKAAPYLDDKDWLAGFVASHIAKGHGPHYVKASLLKKRFRYETAEAAFSLAEQREEEARQIVLQKLEGLDPVKKARRLAARGFSCR